MCVKISQFFILIRPTAGGEWVLGTKMSGDDSSQSGLESIFKDMVT